MHNRDSKDVLAPTLTTYSLVMMPCCYCLMVLRVGTMLKTLAAAAAAAAAAATDQ
jgi:hypothetical protein